MPFIIYICDFHYKVLYIYLLYITLVLIFYINCIKEKVHYNIFYEYM